MFDAATATTNHIMGHQGDYTEPDILDLSSQNCQGFEFNSSTWLSSTLDSQKEKIENRKREWHDKCNIVPISAEELKIRSELGMDIENDLEKEIKEGIYQLALRLHRIYQERKERSAKETFEVENNRGRAVSEVNISIRMEGRSKVEMREVKNNEEKEGPFLRNCRPQNVKEVKKVDWVKSLRGGSSPVCGSRLSSVSSKHKGKKLSTDPNGLSNWKIQGGRGKKVGSFGLEKQNASVDKKILQLGWKV